MVLIEILFMLKKTILITSNTHSAVDNILGKLLQSKRIDTKKILKIGSESRTSSLVRPYCENTLTKNCQTVEELEEFYNNIVSNILIKFPLINNKRGKPLGLFYEN